MSLIAIALLNSLLGVVCGLWFRVLILIPLVVFAFIEVVFLKESGMGLSPFRAAIALVVLLESGYLIGASIAPSLYSIRRKLPHGFTRQVYREMSIIGGGE
jgi:hypothetical protein